jgi:hypothetical protein
MANFLRRAAAHERDRLVVEWRIDPAGAHRVHADIVGANPTAAADVSAFTAPLVAE